MLRCYLECSTSSGKAVKKFDKRSHGHCCFCPQLFRRINDFKTHLACHEKQQKGLKKHKIPKNDCVEDTNATMTRDMQRSKVTKKQSNTCPECGKHYANKNALQRHVREVHNLWRHLARPRARAH